MNEVTLFWLCVMLTLWYGAIKISVQDVSDPLIMFDA